MRTASIDLVKTDFQYSDAVERVLQSGVLVGGEETCGLEREFGEWLGLDDPERVVAVSSGTAALTALLVAHGIGPGDEVIVPDVTFTATAIAVLRTGAMPVFADVLATFSLDSEQITKVCSKRTKAVIGVDFDGVPARWTKLRQAAKSIDVKLFEDACPAYGSRYRDDLAGTLAPDGAAFSLNESKQLPAGEGGLVVAPTSGIAEKIRRMRHFGHPRGGRWAEEPVGDNWKITEMAAALGRVGIPYLTERTMTAKLNGEIVRNALTKSEALSPVPITPGSEPSWFRIRAIAPTPADAAWVEGYLMAKKVPVQHAQEVIPLHRHPAFHNCRHGSVANAEQLDRTFSIGGRADPIFTVDSAEAERWAEVITSLPQEVSPK